MSLRAWFRSFASLASAGIVLVFGNFGCGNGTLVGGECREGLTECSLTCVDLARDTKNCGACGRICAAGELCWSGVCGAGLADGGADGESVDDSGVDGVSVDGSLADGVSNDGPWADVSSDVAAGDARDDVSGEVAAGDARDDVSGDGSSADGPVCAPPFDTPEHCGDCDTRCVEPTSVCGLQGTFKCLSRCESPLEACGTVCINKFSDDKNCGACGTICPSGICQAGSCVGKGYGHEIVIGMDYSDATLSQSSAQVTLLANAVLQSGGASVHVLAYDEYAQPATVVRLESWLTAIATSRGKTVTIDKSAGWTAIPEELTVLNYQVFLVYDQLLAPGEQMEASGTLWNATMNAYAKAGGVVVVLDGGSVGRMRDLLTHGGLLPVTGETDVTGTQVRVDAPTDVVGQNLPNVFAAKQTSVAFTTTQAADNLHVFVVKDATGMLPIVVHSVPPP